MRTTDLSEAGGGRRRGAPSQLPPGREERGVTASAISHAVSNLEARIGLRLLNRDTQRIAGRRGRHAAVTAVSSPWRYQARPWTG